MSETAQGSTQMLAAGFASLVVLTLGLIVLGALVRAHDAGLACPDWPLCFGGAVPRMNLKVAFEWTHRVVAGSVALIFACLAAATWMRVERGHPTRSLLAAAAVLLAVQIALGALTVWLQLRSWTVTAHLITGNAFSFTLVLTALRLRERSGAPLRHQDLSPAGRRGVVAAALLLWIQLALGGLVSSQYAGMACPEWPACNGGVFFPTWSGPVGLHLLHRMNGYALMACLASAAWLCRGDRQLRGPTVVALGVGLAQVVVGIANVLTGIPVELTGLHSALAAILVVTSAFALDALRSAPESTLPSAAG